MIKYFFIRNRREEYSSMRLLLLILLFLDIFALLGCVAIVTSVANLRPDQLPLNLSTMINLAILLGTYSLTALLCNSLAVYGLRTDSRVFLLPYLLFIPLVLTSFIVLIVKNCLTRGLSPESLLIPMALGLVLSVVWLQMVRHWMVMGLGGAGGRDQEAAAAAASPDQPPDYNHVAVQRGGKMESPPPCYEDAVKGAVL